MTSAIMMERTGLGMPGMPDVESEWDDGHAGRRRRAA